MANGIKPSEPQKTVINKFRKTKDNIVINAVAGSGKTTTILMLLPLVRGKSIFLAFNNDIVNELSKRITNKMATVSTLHSIGCKSIMSRYGKVRISKGKTYRFIQKASKKWDIEPKKKNGHFYTVNRLVDMYRLTLCTDESSLISVACKLGISFGKLHIKHALEVMDLLEKYNKSPKEIDFTDMIYIPATNSECELPRTNTLFIDEAQDLNRAQHAMVDKIISQGARFVAVGDPMQSIYSFAGSDSKSFDMFVNRPRTVVLPLSICYRCPGRVIDHANEVYDILEPAENAIDGVVRVGDVWEAEKGDMIICRNLSPLIGVYFSLIADNKRCAIKGKDIGENLIVMIENFKGQDFNSMEDGLQRRLHDKINELLSRGMTSPNKHPSYQALLERIQWIYKISVNYVDVNDMMEGLTNIFKDDLEDSIILSTIHKAKGLESDNVFLLNRSLIPSKYAETEDQLVQEQNLLYIAITRAKKSFIYCKE